MSNLNYKLGKVKLLLNTTCFDNNLYMRIYSFATENINGYLDYFDFQNKNLLTDGSSGDQILNSYYKGCRDITLLDINLFAKYYVNLKIAAIIIKLSRIYRIFL